MSLTLERLDEVRMRWIAANFTREDELTITTALGYARERAARERCEALLPRADGVDGVLSLTCRYDESGVGTWGAEASIFEGNMLRGDTPRARADSPTEAYEALAAALGAR